jgi:transposase InsO family protein
MPVIVPRVGSLGPVVTEDSWCLDAAPYRRAAARRLTALIILESPTWGASGIPYLLRHRTITRPNEVWAMDITYIPMAHGFVHLAAVLDWARPSGHLSLLACRRASISRPRSRRGRVCTKSRPISSHA